MITYRPSAKFDKPATLVLLDQEQIRAQRYVFANKFLKKEISRLSSLKQFSGENGQLFPVLDGKKLYLLCGVGKRAEFSLTALRVTIRRALLSPYLKAAKETEIVVSEVRDDIVRAVIEAVVIGTYSWKKYRTQEKNDKTAKKFFLAATSKKVYEDTVKICTGVNLTRDLINDNADTVTSDYVEKTIRTLIKGKRNISIEVLNRKEMKRKRLGLHLAVNQGSNKEPKLIIVKYKGAANRDNFTAFIGKGMTYDTGGLNLKTSGHIETMRMDMSGAAAVVGTLKNVIALNLRKNILFVCAMAENAIDANAYKPGDVLKSYSGKTVEVANTDAEGRLVLADAISYVIKNYKPARLIDAATLTGACIVALGHDYTGLMSNDEKFAQRLLHAAQETDDRAWQLPIYPELKDSVKSQIADIRNLGFPRGAGGTITAAEFLHQFVGETPWVHLDIAGSAFVDNSERMYFSHGATGAAVRMVTYFLQNH